MRKATAEALEKSIAHWERLSTGTEGEREAIYAEHCALCARFPRNCQRKNTEGSVVELCPVARKTGHNYCRDTPWQSAEEAWSNRKYASYPIATTEQRAKLDKAFRHAAKRMLKFLKSLREK